MSEALSMRYKPRNETMAAGHSGPDRRRAAKRGRDLDRELTPDWVVLRGTAGDTIRDPLVDHLGRPGLWRPATAIDGECCIFELPRSLFPESHPPWRGIDADVTFREAVEWAATTRPGNSLSLGWVPPPLERIRACLPEQAMTVRAGTLARQGTVVHSPQRLALEFPVVACPSDLAPERRRWLHELLIDAQTRWRLVRFGFVRRDVRAEIDLTGVPASMLEPLLPVALECLRHVIARVLEPAQFLVDGADCRALSLHPGRD